ncbi:hypothetical protein [Thiofilum flexile]|uniref:hypothetical protein n=1 Tax=Thiofilum flexile TaxID=125627 RepID=UPI0003696389|nr:hypothetical protein [Thiofilum flexile]
MLEPQPAASERLSFQAWLQAEGGEPKLSQDEQTALQQYLLWQAACEEANTLTDQAVEPILEQFYQRLAITPPEQTTTVPVTQAPKPTWWERFGFSGSVLQPMWLASAAMLLIAVLGARLLWQHQPLSTEPVTIEVTRDASVGLPNPKPINDKNNDQIPLKTLLVEDIKTTKVGLIRDLRAVHFTVTEVSDLDKQGTILIIHTPDAPLTQSTRQILQHYQVTEKLSTPNTTIRLYLKPATP